MDHDTARIRIVLVDEHTEARDALERRARRHPRLDVVGATDSPEMAVRLVEEQRPDVVLIDIKRSDGRSGETIPLLRALDAAIRPCIVVYVALLTRAEEQAAGRLGADAVLLKQLSTATLADELATVLAAASCRVPDGARTARAHGR
ncbi:MAG TPA: response regulator [Dehalococcoidia bacterium]|jgi:DNA-binding NarL/FixJ family response regulator|nr:response regulator [Dehalococcoidia bacterium]